MLPVHAGRDPAIPLRPFNQDLVFVRHYIPMSIIGTFAREKRGAVAVEFAFMASILLFTLLFIIVVALILYINQALDYAVAKASRQVMTGYVQTNSIGQQAFQSQVVCNYLPSIISCGDVIVNLYTVQPGTSPSSYYNFVNSSVTALTIPPLSNGSATYQLGGQGVYQYLEVVYPITFLPRFLASIVSGGASYNGSPAYLAVSTAAFRNEQY